MLILGPRPDPVEIPDRKSLTPKQRLEVLVAFNGRCAKGRNKMSGAHVRALSYEQAQAIRFEYTGRRGEQSSLGRKYGVSVGIIWNIVNNKAYKRPFEASTLETPHEGQ